ncbi:MAG: hypothetical protein J6C40_13120 [Lentisphaeria bacterium]|nr:hypothetical protein [Lentisphaeria bacterium]
MLAQGLWLDQTASLAAPRPFCPTSPTCPTCLTCPTSPPVAAKVPRTTDRCPRRNLLLGESRGVRPAPSGLSSEAFGEGGCSNVAAITRLFFAYFLFLLKRK